MALTERARVSWAARYRPLLAFSCVFGPLLGAYLLIPNPGLYRDEIHADPFTNVVSAWQIGVKGSVVVEDFVKATRPEYHGNIGWFVDSRLGPVGQYPPGAALFGAPFYLVAGRERTMSSLTGSNNPHAPPLRVPMPSPRIGTIAASVAVAGAMGFLALAIFRASGSTMLGVGAGLVGGLATPLWPVAASALWLHAPAAFWLALGIYFSSRDGFLWSGVAFGMAILTRPHLAAVPLAIGATIAWGRQRLRPLVLMGIGSLGGLLALIAYNWWLWERFTITGGYSSVFTENLAALDLWGFVENVVGAMIDPRVGVVMVTPFIVLLALHLRPAWRESPSWARGAALGGLLYLLIQLKANRYTGGDGFVGYRYSLETLVAAGPLLTMAYPHLARRSKVFHWGLWVLVVGSISLFWFWWDLRL